MKRYFITFIAVSILVLNGCNNRQIVKNINPVSETGTTYLTGTAKQPDGYGLYSYILFASEPTSSESYNRYLETMKLFVSWPEIKEARQYYKPKQLNLMAVPIKEELMVNPEPELILDLYNYIRARAILNCLPREAEKTGGPYLVSTMKPLKTGQVYKDHYLIQDLSRVPAHLIPMWINDFKKQVTKPRFWEKNALRETAKALRTAVAIAAKGLPDIMDSLNTVITVVQKPEENE